MLMNAVDILRQAGAGRYAIGQFNLNGFEWIKAILQLAESTRTPVILGVNEKAAEYMCGYEAVSQTVRAVDRALKVTAPVVLHADHSGFASSMAALRAGFTSVMYDGSHEDWEDNLRLTAEVVRAAKRTGASTEAEAGVVGGEEDGISGEGELASVEMCSRLAACGIDILAAGIGNIHGAYPEDWQGLNFSRLDEIRRATGDLPLALHGGSGIPENMLARAIAGGIRKINVNTECKDGFYAGIVKRLAAGKASPFDIYQAGIDGIEKTAAEKMSLFGCLGKAT